MDASPARPLALYDAFDPAGAAQLEAFQLPLATGNSTDASISIDGSGRLLLIGKGIYDVRFGCVWQNTSSPVSPTETEFSHPYLFCGAEGSDDGSSWTTEMADGIPTGDNAIYLTEFGSKGLPQPGETVTLGGLEGRERSASQTLSEHPPGEVGVGKTDVVPEQPVHPHLGEIRRSRDAFK